MFHFLKLSLSPRRWNASRFSHLPSLDSAEDEIQLDHCLLAGGLALLLSRCSESQIERDYTASVQAYCKLKDQMGSDRSTPLSADLLMDLSHEIAQCADSATRMAARRCMARSVASAMSASCGPRPLPSH
jgi:hypothetical protein